MIRGDKGFTLAEVLVATAFIAITAGAIGVGFMQGTGSVETGRQQTTAVYLAEQRLEQLKAGSLNSTGGQGSAAGAASPACSPQDAFHAIPDQGHYPRARPVTPPAPHKKGSQASALSPPATPG